MLNLSNVLNKMRSICVCEIKNIFQLSVDLNFKKNGQIFLPR